MWEVRHNFKCGKNVYGEWNMNDGLCNSRVTKDCKLRTCKILNQEVCEMSNVKKSFDNASEAAIV